MGTGSLKVEGPAYPVMAEFEQSIFDQRIDQTPDFDAVVSFHRPRIFRFALASLRDRDEAETVTQDCFLRAFRARGDFRNECSIQTWLMQIAVNLIRDRLRSRRFRFWQRRKAFEDLGGSLPESATAGISPEKAALLRQQVQSVWVVASGLPERQRTVFLLRFVEDMDILEIAAATGLKEGTVKTHLLRALRSVRERLGSLV